jgi:hypothetical protein
MPKDTISDLANGLAAPAFASDLPETGAPIDKAGHHWRELQALDDHTTAQIHEIDANVDWTASGKSKESHKVAKAALSELLKLKSDHREYVEAQVRKARREHTPETIEPGAAAIRQWETRQQIAERVGNDGLAMRVLLDEAEAVGDVETLSAIADAQISWPQHELVPDHQELAKTLASMADTALGDDVAALIEADRQLDPLFENVARRLELVMDPMADDNLRVRDDAEGDSDDD